MVTTLDDMLMM